MTGLQSILREERAAAVLEFALLAPVFMLILFGTIEASRLLWLQQTLDEVAYSTARCMSVSAQCATSEQQKDYAVARAASYGLSVADDDVAAQDDVTCRGFPGSSRISIEHGFDSVLAGFTSAFPRGVEANACYPALS